jgi:hypothetical protein
MKDDSSISLSDITNADFSETTEPRDDYLIELLGRAYRGEIDCYIAVIKLEAIKPFSDYKPTISNDYRNHFNKKYKQGSPPQLYVYEKDGEIIMSDDYNSYFLYKELGAEEAVCVAIGPIDNVPGVLMVGKPFKLPKPTAEMIE